MDLSTSIFSNEMATEYLVQDDICRFCLAKAAEHEILDMTTEEKESDLCSMILFCLDIKLNANIIPNKICQSCAAKIENFYNFKKLCQKTHKRFEELLKQKNCSIISLGTKAMVVKLEDTENILEETPETESIDDFLDSLYPSDNGSEDEVPLKELKRKHPVNKTRLKKQKSNFKCHICSIHFENKVQFNLHNSECHGIEENGFKCFGCEKIFKTRTGRVGHETSFCKYLKNGFKCTKCNKYLPTRGCYEKHMNNHRKKTTEELVEDVMKCKKCSEEFQSIEDLKKHKDSHSTRKRKYVCETCGKVFTRHDYLHKHKLTHTGTKQHQCTHCGFRTLQKSSLTVHIRKHTGERPFSCDLCPQQCVSSSNLQAHRRRHLGLKEYQCSLCSKKFGYKTSLEEHFASTHDRSQTHSCTLCNATYSRIRGLKRHILAKHDKKTTINDSKNETTKNGSDVSKLEQSAFEIHFIAKDGLSSDVGVG